MTTAVMQIVPSVEALKSFIQPSDGMLFKTLGQYQPFDGYAQEYIYKEGAFQITDPVGTVIHKSSGGRFLSFKEDGTLLNICQFGARGYGDDTEFVQAAIDYAYNNHQGAHVTVRVPTGRFRVSKINMRNHVRLVGYGEGTSHSAVALHLGFGSEFIQLEGTNDDMFVWSEDLGEQGNDSKSVSDAGIENVSIRGNWTGPGDTTTTAGSAIKFDDVTPTQGVRIQNLLIANFAEDAIELTRHALPNTMSNIWGRQIGGFVINCKTVNGRITHMFAADKIQGDFLVGGLINVDESTFEGSNSSAASTYSFTNCKHEIDSSATETDVYSPNTFIFNNVDRAVVTLINCDTQPSNPLGGGEPNTNALLKITGTKAPYYNVIGCRMGSSNATADYLVDDEVNGVQISKKNRNASNCPKFDLIVGHTLSTIYTETRKKNDDTGVIDTHARFKKDISGKFYWGSGETDPDVNLYRSTVGRLITDTAFQAKKLFARGGTQLQASDFQLSAGWGSTASVTIDSVSNSNHDQRFRIIVTCGGSGIAANPTVTLPFVDGFLENGQKWAVPPVAVCGMGSESTGAIAQISTGTRNISNLVMSYNGTPSAGLTYVIDAIMMG